MTCGIELKLQAFGKLPTEHQEIRGQVGTGVFCAACTSMWGCRVRGEGRDQGTAMQHFPAVSVLSGTRQKASGQGLLKSCCMPRSKHV